VAACECDVIDSHLPLTIVPAADIRIDSSIKELVPAKLLSQEHELQNLGLRGFNLPFLTSSGVAAAGFAVIGNHFK